MVWVFFVGAFIFEERHTQCRLKIRFSGHPHGPSTALPSLGSPRSASPRMGCRTFPGNGRYLLKYKIFLFHCRIFVHQIRCIRYAIYFDLFQKIIVVGHTTHHVFFISDIWWYFSCVAIINCISKNLICYDCRRCRVLRKSFVFV